MAHNIKEHDSMLAVGQRPWHGLGITLAEPPSSALEALQLAKADWTVSKRMMFLDDRTPVKVSGSVAKRNEGLYGAITRDDTNDVLGVVGPGYTPLQNRVIADLYQPLIEENVAQIESCGTLFNGRRVWMLGKLKADKQTIKNGDDVVDRYLMLAHGHDGQMAVRFGFTYVRVVCWNTLSLAVEGKSSQLIRCLHTANLEQNLTILRNSVVASAENFEITADEYRLLASRGVSRADLREYARVLVDANPDSSKWTKQQADKVGKIVGMACEGRGNNGNTWWDAYNGFTEYLTWSSSRTAQVRFDSLWFGSASTKNGEALSLALSMSS